MKSLEKEDPSLRITRVRHTEQKGLSYARVSGWRASTADVVAILDAHIEVHEMWYDCGSIWSRLTCITCALLPNQPGGHAPRFGRRKYFVLIFHSSVVANRAAQLDSQMSHFSCGHCAAFTVYCSDGGGMLPFCAGLNPF